MMSCLDLPRPRKRMTEFLLKIAQRESGDHSGDMHCEFRYLRSPVRVIPRGEASPFSPGKSNVSGLELRVNKLEVCHHILILNISRDRQASAKSVSSTKAPR